MIQRQTERERERERARGSSEVAANRRHSGQSLPPGETICVALGWARRKQAPNGNEGGKEGDQLAILAIATNRRTSKPWLNPYPFRLIDP